MSGNSAFIPVQERGWRGGLNNMLRGEFGKWWGSNLWWIQSLIWIGVINGILAGILWGGEAATIEEGVALYCVFSGLFPTIAIIIIMQEVVVGDKDMGTAAWILSKPGCLRGRRGGAPPGCIVGVLVTMLLLPGIIAYLMFYL